MLTHVFAFSPFFVITTIVSKLLAKLNPIVNMLMIKFVFDSLTNESWWSIDIIFVVITLMSILALASVFNTWYMDYYRPIAEDRFHLFMKEKVYKKIAKIDLLIHESPEYYDRYLRASNEAVVRPIAIMDSATDLFALAFQSATTIAIIALLDTVLLIIAAIGFIVPVVVSIWKNKFQYMFRIESTKRNKPIKYFDRIMYMEDYSKEYKIFPLNTMFISKLKTYYTELIETKQKYGKLFSIFDVLVNTHQIVVIGVMIIYLINQIKAGILTIGDFSVLLTGTQQLIGIFSRLFSIFPEMHKNSLYISDYKRFMDFQPSIETEQNVLRDDISHFKELKLNSVSFGYVQNDLILKNIDITIKKGDKIALLGKNGAGKSTLIKLLLRLYDCQKGHLEINGQEYSSFNVLWGRKILFYY